MTSSRSDGGAAEEGDDGEQSQSQRGELPAVLGGGCFLGPAFRCFPELTLGYHLLLKHLHWVGTRRGESLGSFGGFGGFGFVATGQHGAGQQDQHDGDNHGFHSVVFHFLLVLVDPDSPLKSP